MHWVLPDLHSSKEQQRVVIVDLDAAVSAANELIVIRMNNPLILQNQKQNRQKLDQNTEILDFLRFNVAI